jgi:hypothetical protein
MMAKEAKTRRNRAMRGYSQHPQTPPFPLWLSEMTTPVVDIALKCTGFILRCRKARLVGRRRVGWSGAGAGGQCCFSDSQPPTAFPTKPAKA